MSLQLQLLPLLVHLIPRPPQIIRNPNPDHAIPSAEMLHLRPGEYPAPPLGVVLVV